MRSPAYLCLSRHSVYYFRWPLPKSLHPGGKPSALKRSLETREPLEALRLARYLSHIAEVVTARGIASGTGVETLSPRTVNKYLQTYKGLFQWAKQHGYVPTNVFEGMTVRIDNDEVGVKRTAYTPDQVSIILNELLRSGSKLVKKDYQKWGPLIAFYSGARLNEISQLQTEDIREVDGVLCFDLNDVGDRKSVKTATSRRLVPVHPKLVDLGFLDYVERMRSENKSKLFPTLTYCEKNGCPG